RSLPVISYSTFLLSTQVIDAFIPFVTLNSREVAKHINGEEIPKRIRKNASYVSITPSHIRQDY
ncbi:TPA: hypothetical protein ACJWJE_004403, partial [Salmonella enterica subsp. enterica serovar Oslo]